MSASQPSPEQIYEYYHKLLIETLPAEKRINNMDSLLRQFPGKEHVVYVQICKKCGVSPVLKPSPQDILSYLNRSISITQEERTVSQWLMSKGFAKLAVNTWFSDMKWESFLTITPEQLQDLGVSKSDATLILALIAEETGDRKEKDQTNSSEPVVNSDFVVGEDCLTKVCSEGPKGTDIGEKWLTGRITHINSGNTFDIFVYDSDAHGVPSEAVDVPRDMLRKCTENVKVEVPKPRKKPEEGPRFKQGDRVRVFGLRSHVNYNGMYGKILLHIPSEKRYQVQLDTYDVIAIRQKNVAPADPNFQHNYEVALKSAEEKMLKYDSAIDRQELSSLILKLMKNNPGSKPEKVGEFAVGYLSAVASMKKDKLSN